jgi:predicted N-acetyltransferase YhbS
VVYPITLGHFDPAVDWSAFDCGDEDLNGFIRDDAAALATRDVSRLFVAYEDGEPCGYVALLADTLVLKTDKEKEALDLHSSLRNPPKSVPALKVGRLAVDVGTKKRVAGVGSTLMWLAVQQAIAIRSRMGCRLLTVDAYPASVPFYETLEFIKCKPTLLHRGCPKCSKPMDTCPKCFKELEPLRDPSTVSMYFDLKLDPAPAWTVGILAKRREP